MALKNKSGISNLQNRYKKNMDNIPELPDNDTQTHAAAEAVMAEPQQNENKNKKQKYLRLDITDYQEYISLMADHSSNTSGKYVSMTQYILRLIEADKQQNIKLYEKLEQIENMKRELI